MLYAAAMVICFNATPAAKKALDVLLATGQFADASDAISIALTNYEVIHEEVSQAGHLRHELPQTSVALGNKDSAQINGATAAHREDTPSASPYIPEMFALKAPALEALSLLSAPAPPQNGETALPPAHWLFGQYNKFLPAKATCRALLNLLSESPGGLSPNEAVSKISFAACALGDYLSALDSRLRLRREESFSAAFPSSAITDGDSRTRFGTQFVASFRQGQLSGLPASLRLIAAESGKDPRISLTRSGAEFAAMPNPILDERKPAPAHKFSAAETEFLLAHISHSVPEEMAAYTAVIDAIDAGANTPDRLDAFLRKRFRLPTEKEITKTFLTTQRTGAISRMADLGLLAREKDGLRVTYLITGQGSTLKARLRRPA